jgi:hypothetical protein
MQQDPDRPTLLISYSPNFTFEITRTPAQEHSKGIAIFIGTGG